MQLEGNFISAIYSGWKGFVIETLQWVDTTNTQSAKKVFTAVSSPKIKYHIILLDLVKQKKKTTAKHILMAVDPSGSTLPLMVDKSLGSYQIQTIDYYCQFSG